MHEFMHENMKINAKGRVKWTYRPRERKTLQKFDEQHFPSWREKEKFEKVLKKMS